jgi:hypothetical protein
VEKNFRRAAIMRFCVVITLFSVLNAATQDHLAALGITAGRAREAVFDSFITDTLSVAGDGKVFTTASPGARIAIVNFALSLARAFTESEDFKRRYADHREANGPDPLPEEPNVDEILAKQRAGFEAQVEQMRKLFDQITPEQRATLEAGWTDMRAQLTDIETGPKRAEFEKALGQRRGIQVRERELAMQELDAVWPADHRALVASRLRHFLEVSKDVAYGARLLDKDGRKVFADPTLEAKPKEWKMCFRAGKAATDAARGFAQKWLSDLQGQGIKDK